VAETPPTGGRRASTGTGRPSTARPSSALPVDDDEQTDITARPSPSLKPRVTRSSFMLDLRAGSPVGEYEIQEQIGEGAMGTVYSAVHPLIGKRVAIKVLKPELCANQTSIDRFVQEAQAVNKIGHPNIVDVFLMGELPDGRAYLIMEWLGGEDLKTRLARGPLTVADTCDILDGIARALDAAHAKHIVHRDLKPDNVFLHKVDDGPLMVKLLDFGIAKLLKSRPGAEKTQTGNMLGTPRYISPEQARGIDVDHRADIYSLGETAMDLVIKHLGEPPPPLSQFAKVPKGLEQCVMRMLAKDPAQRPSLEELRGILVDPSRRLTPLPIRGTSAYTMPFAPAPRRWPIYAVATVAAIGLGVLTWKLVSMQQESAPTNAAVTPVVAPTQVAPPPPLPPAMVVAPPARGTLEVAVTGAMNTSIFVDGQQWGTGEAIKVELDPGDHSVEVKAPGRAVISQHVDITSGQSVTLTMAVPPPAVVRPTPRPVARPVKKPAPQLREDDLLRPKGHK
jgi:tRNA A-37 threonylcarbamoyl transferase component Bud32